jgi:hypothetical protein
MTGVKINGEFLVVNALRITFELENSIFSEDVIFTGFSVPGEAPVCEINNRILAFGYKLNLKEKTRQYPCEFYFKGLTVFFGTFNLLETSRNSYRWNISISGLSAELLDKKLNEIDYGENFILGNTTEEVYATLNDMAQQFYPKIPVCFPITENALFYGSYQDQNSANPDFKGYLNAWKSNSQEYWRNNIIQSDTEDNIQSFVPWVFTQFILKRIFATAGWNVTGTFVNDPELSQHILYSGRALDKTVEVGFFRGKTPGINMTPQTLFPKDTWININVQELEDPDNRFDLGKYEVPLPHPGSGVNQIGYFEFLFDFKAFFATPGPIFVTTELWFGILFDGDPVSSTEILDNLLPDSYDGTDYRIAAKSKWLPVSRAGTKFRLMVRYGQASGTDVAGTLTLKDIQIKAVSLSSLNLLENSIPINRFVPDLTVRDFMKNLRDVFALTFTPKLATKEVAVDYYQPKLTTVPNNLTHKALYEYNSTLEEGTEYFFSFAWGENDETEKDNFKTTESYLFLGNFPSENDLPPAFAPNKVALVLNQNRFFLTVKNPLTQLISWKYFADNFQPLTTGEGAVKEIIPAMRPVFMTGKTTDVQESFRVSYIKPVIKTKGNSPCYGLGIENAQPLKMAFWKGLQPSKEETDYPMATPYRYLDDGTEPFPVSLTWSEPVYGLFDRHWKRIVNAIKNTELVEMDAMLDTAEIAEFDITRVQLVEDVYLAIKRMRITFGTDQPEPTEFEMYRL